MRTFAAVAAAVVAVAALGAAVPAASGSASPRPCPTVRVATPSGQGHAVAKITIVKGTVRCIAAQRVTRAFYVAVARDAKRDSRGRLHVARHWTCETGLGGSQGFCTYRSSAIGMTTRRGAA